MEPPRTIRHPNGTPTVTAADNGHHVIITTTAECPPWIVTVAAREAKRQLMSGARQGQESA